MLSIQKEVRFSGSEVICCPIKRGNKRKLRSVARTRNSFGQTELLLLRSESEPETLISKANSLFFIIFAMPTVVFIQGNAIPVKHTQRSPKKLECKMSRDENGNVQNWSRSRCRNCGGRKFWTWEKKVCSVTIPNSKKYISVSEKKEEKCSVRNKTCFETTLTQKVVCPQNGSHP